MALAFEQLIGLAEESVMQDLLGEAAYKLMRLLDEESHTPAGMRKLLLRLYPPTELLRSPTKRALLLDLLPLEVAKDLVTSLGLEAPDPYALFRGLKLRKGSKQERQLLMFFGIEAEQELTPDQVLPAPQVSTEPKYGLWDYQRSVVYRASAAIAAAPHRLLMHMPTGSGKTRTAMHFVASRLSATEPMLVVWLAASEELCEQAASEFERAWSYLGNRPVTVARFWGTHEPDWTGLTDGILVAGLQKMHQRARADLKVIARLSSRTRLVVIDEAHGAVADTHERVLKTLVLPSPPTELLGLTATPGRTWDDIDADRQLSEFFNRNKVGIASEGHGSAVGLLIERGFLARPEFESLTHEGGLSISEVDRRSIEAALEIPPSIVARLADDAIRNLRIVLRIQKLLTEHRRIILFAATVEHSDLLAAVLSARGINASSVTMSSSPDFRRGAIARFKSDDPEPMILCNFGVLTTGFDAPRTTAAVIARPTKSLVLYLQMIGRAIRGPAAGGSETATIVTVVDQGLPGFRDVSEAFLNWEDVWSTESNMR